MPGALSYYYPCAIETAHEMSVMVSQITSVSIVYWPVCSGADQRKYQSPASLALL